MIPSFLIDLIGIARCQNEELVARLSKRCAGEFVSAPEFIDKAFAVRIEIDARGKRNRMIGGAGIGIRRRKELDVAHINQIRPDLLGHFDAVARNRRHIGRHDAVPNLFIPDGVVMDTHIDIGAEPARRKDDAVFGQYFKSSAVFCSPDNTGRTSILHQDVRCCRIHDEGDGQMFCFDFI